MAIIGDLDELEATILDHDRDGGGVSIQAVLDQLFHGGYRPLDDLTGGDSIYHSLVEAVDPRWLHLIGSECRLFDLHWACAGGQFNICIHE